MLFIQCVELVPSFRSFDITKLGVFVLYYFIYFCSRMKHVVYILSQHLLYFNHILKIDFFVRLGKHQRNE